MFEEENASLKTTIQQLYVIADSCCMIHEIREKVNNYERTGKPDS